MRKKIISFLLMVAGVTGLGFIAPWWVGAPWIVLIAVIFKLKEWEGIRIGGLALGIVSLIAARLMSTNDEAGIISKTGTLLGGLSHQMMMVATLVIALITGMLSGWLGSRIGKAIPSKPDEIV